MSHAYWSRNQLISAKRSGSPKAWLCKQRCEFFLRALSLWEHFNTVHNQTQILQILRTPLHMKAEGDWLEIPHSCANQSHLAVFPEPISSSFPLSAEQNKKKSTSCHHRHVKFSNLLAQCQTAAHKSNAGSVTRTLTWVQLSGAAVFFLVFFFLVQNLDYMLSISIIAP